MSDRASERSPISLTEHSEQADGTHASAASSGGVELAAIPLSEEEQMKKDAQIAGLLTAASKGNVSRVRTLLASGVSATCADYDFRTALHLACSEGHMETAQLLVAEGADPNSKDRFGSTPLDDAMRGNHHDLVTFLRSVNATHGGLAQVQAKLFDLVSKGELRKVQMLLTKDVKGNLVPGAAGISPNCVDYDRRTPLHLAVVEGHLELVELLLENGADPHAQDRWGLTPIAEAERQAARVGSDPIKQAFRDRGHLEHEEPGAWTFFSVFFGFWEVAMMILFGLFVEYGPRADGGGAEQSTIGDVANANSLIQNEITRVYAMYQDVHVMIFVGFGFLMVFLRKHGYTSVGMTFLIAAFVIQWYHLCAGFWENVFGHEWHKIPLSIETLVKGDFAAGSVLIAFGAVLGKVNPPQVMFMAIIQTIFYTLNEEIGTHIGVADLGGSMTIHMFGAAFGLGVSYMITPKEARGHEQNAAGYHSDIFAMIGTIFLWLFWPSFNACLSAAQLQERAVINTVLGLCGSCVVAFIASHVLRRERQFNMVDIQNATLAGGVALGASCDMIILPGSAIGIGGVAGFVSVAGYVYLQPFLENSIGLHDTCGVLNLHGMPSIIGGFASVIAASMAEVDGVGAATGYGVDQLTFLFVKRTGVDGEGRTANHQALIQFVYILTSLFIALFSGLLTGHHLTLKMFGSTDPKNMYVDSEYWEVPHKETPYYFDRRGEIAHPNETVPLVEGDKGTNGKVEGSPNFVEPENADWVSNVPGLANHVVTIDREARTAAWS